MFKTASVGLAARSARRRLNKVNKDIDQPKELDNIMVLVCMLPQQDCFSGQLDWKYAQTDLI
jgi:hypothetical protein